jgi:HSP20 family protein
MAENTTKLPVKTEKASPSTLRAWPPFESLRREVDRLFEEIGGSAWRSPLHKIEAAFGNVPAVDLVETDKAYEVTAELPGMDEKNVEVKLAHGVLIIKGHKQDEKEETKKDYYMRERSFGSFERSFAVPDGIDADKVEAIFKKGVLSVTLPKTAEAQKSEHKITVKAA